MHTTRCVNAGHCPDRIVEAVQKQVATLDYAPTFNMGHPLAFEYAHRLASEMYPGKVRTHFGGQGGGPQVCYLACFCACCRGSSSREAIDGGHQPCT